MTTYIKFAVLVALPIISLSYTSLVTEKSSNKVVELSAVNVTSNLRDWNTDLAILFYAPWCKYCKQLLPSWQEIAKTASGNKNLIVGRFNCEEPVSNSDLCKKLKVDRYPSLFYIGYGNFNQGLKGSIFFNSASPNVVKFVSDLYPEAILDWVSMLSSISMMQRRWDEFKAIFSGRSRASLRLERLQSRLFELESKVQLFSKELEKYKANELFDQLNNNGDVFVLLNKLEPDEVIFIIFSCYDHDIYNLKLNNNNNNNNIIIIIIK
jgi:thiol-disulfide isomerase/thioredoxin